MRILTKADLTDILYGCAILGTGGGGELDEGFDYINKALAAGKTFKLVSVDEVPAGSMICTPYMLGALSSMSDEQEQAYRRLPQSGEPAIMTAYKRLLDYTGEQFYGTICCELGGSNTAISFYVAAMADGYIIDADPAGRAVPEITHSTYYFNGLPAAPVVTANEFGECFVLENIVDDQRAEQVVRALSMVSRNDIAAIDHAMPIEQVKDAVIKGSISMALEVGQAYRLAREQGLDVATQVAQHGGGYVAFRGEVCNFEFATEDGFTIGSIGIAGTDDFAGSRYQIEVKNENLVARLNGEVDVTIPDLICCLDVDSGQPVTNPNVTMGANLAIVVLPAPKEFTTEKGLQAFGPRYVGLTQAYQPAVARHFRVSSPVTND
ncbi:DUF917 domain-containing protein [Neiella marina]|uniref:DUF917 domain-containing protein n=1 Tax=Neiella holothuriorum TaxID=2870530 RepID=A0ABS7EC00_9GAMM|nr:DUF917 domain-containing protein [Neiella holothuriorum]MBW8189850.1 DUF917 domain-containing protein [Neiella holothuriorum]